MNTLFLLIFFNIQTAQIDTLPVTNNTFVMLNTSTSCISCYYLASKEINELVKNYTVINLNILNNKDFFTKFINDYNQEQIHKFASDSATLKSKDSSFSQVFSIQNNEGLILFFKNNKVFAYPFDYFFDKNKNFKRKSFRKIIKTSKR